MRRARFTWLVFALCLTAVAAAMGWASLTVLRLDRAQEAGLRQGDLEERVRLSLWRMDSAVTPLIALENARPYFAYTAFYPLERAYTRLFSQIEPQDVLVPSPLLTATPPHVQIHFQFGPGGELTSPQAPTGNMQDLAESGYIGHDRVEAAAARLKELQGFVSPERLLAAIGTDGEVPHWGGPAEAGTTTAPARGVARGISRDQPAQQAVRNKAEWQARYQGQRAAVNAQNAPDEQSPSQAVKQGEMKALWVGKQLLLARRVTVGGQEYLQGCWLDWDAIRGWLLPMLADLLPGADLTAAAGDAADAATRPDSPIPATPRGWRTLANLPVRLAPGPLDAAAARAPSVLWVSLAIAWGCVVLAAGVAGRVLQRALSLSERRGAFVSAVTHEMRTPLTTFRLYTEMLSEGMVSDEAKRAQYLSVLRTESERLGHLVENVLAYARLEGPRAGANPQTVRLSEVVAKAEGQLARRAAQGGMELAVEGPSPGAADGPAADPRIRADTSAVEQVLMNLVDNACKYASRATDRRIHLRARLADGHAELAVADHGPGVPPGDLGRLFQAFSKSAHQAAASAPGIGLGLALSRRLARDMGGDLRLENAPGDGACFVLTLPLADGAG
jgi:signal transduction histidine kinase